MRCGVCFRHCDIPEGGTGFCGGRTAEGGRVVPSNYGRITSMALDPIEKKPLNRFHPGGWILSVGSYGCNLNCPFCQNYEISREGYGKNAAQTRPGHGRRRSAAQTDWRRDADRMTPEELTELAVYYRSRGNMGLAFTYNEPLIGWEFVRDTARLVHEAGMFNVLVTNGTAELSVLEELLPWIDAMNIDLKSWSSSCCREVLGGDRDMVLRFIERAVQGCHVELTTLIVPGLNDSEEDMRSQCRWIAGLEDAEGRRIGTEIPLHISRFFPRYHMTDRPATDVRKVYRLAEIAREQLNYVYTGNC